MKEKFEITLKLTTDIETDNKSVDYVLSQAYGFTDQIKCMGFVDEVEIDTIYQSSLPIKNGCIFRNETITQGE